MTKVYSSDNSGVTVPVHRIENPSWFTDGTGAPAFQMKLICGSTWTKGDTDRNLLFSGATAEVGVLSYYRKGNSGVATFGFLIVKFSQS